jgi:hypothetical protein
MRKIALLALAMICVSAPAFSQMTQQRTVTLAPNRINPGGTTPTQTGPSITGGVPNPVTPLVGPSGMENTGIPRQGSPTFQNGITATPPLSGTTTQIVPNSTSQMVPNSVAPNSTAQIAPNAAPEVPQVVPNSVPKGLPNSTNQIIPNSTANSHGTCGWACDGSNCEPVGCSGPPGSAGRQASQ